MIAGVSIDESVKAFGTKGCTNTPDVISALRKLNIPCGEKLIRIGKTQKSSLCMVTLHARKDKKYLHWVVYENGLYYDPASGIGKDINGPLLNPLTNLWHTYDIERYETSFLPIFAGREHDGYKKRGQYSF